VQICLSQEITFTSKYDNKRKPKVNNIATWCCSKHFLNPEDGKELSSHKIAIYSSYIRTSLNLKQKEEPFKHKDYYYTGRVKKWLSGGNVVKRWK
jgi:hypothetical protein